MKTIKVEHMEIWGFEHAVRGMRNPMNSWDKSDSGFMGKPGERAYIGENDTALMQKLYNAGPEHRKYARQIFVGMDITAPLYWWKEFDTYKVGTTANSCSTMHRIMSKPFEMSDFSFEKAVKTIRKDLFDEVLEVLNDHRDVYLNYDEYLANGIIKGEFSKKDLFDAVIQLLPSSYNQKRTITMTCENVFNIIHQREHHKLDEWKEFVNILFTLPYVSEITGKRIE